MPNNPINADPANIMPGWLSARYIQKMHRIKKLIKVFFKVISIIAVFAAGVLLGMKYHDFDVLCDNSPEAYVLNADLRTENGIILPKGTIVPRQECKHEDRFHLSFYLPHLFDHDDLFIPFTPENDKDLLALKRGTIFQYGLETIKEGN
jgi:hypothetical protein